MKVLAFAWRSLVRQPARTLLGIIGVAAVGALLLDMLLLSRGLVISMQSLLDRGGFNVRVTSTPSVPGSGPRIPGAVEAARAMATLAEVDEAVPLLIDVAEIESRDRARPLLVSFFGAAASRRRPWTVVEGHDLSGSGRPTGEVLLNRTLADRLGRRPGDEVRLRASCGAPRSILPPTTMVVVGIARFPFDDPMQLSASTTFSDAAHACGNEGRDEADMVLVASSEGVDGETARLAIERLEPNLVALTNEQLVARLQQAGFSYFRQISTVLAVVTLSFALLLITVLLTVSVNQRLGEIASLRALGFSARRVVADVLCESALIVGIGGALALPLGIALAAWLDWILKTMPGIPAELHFFVFEPRAVAVYVALLAATAIVAALYPMCVVARLPIATTLRNETVS